MPTHGAVEFGRADSLLYSDYGRGLFERVGFARLPKALNGLRGRFILPLNDAREAWQIFAGFDIETVGTTHIIGARGNGELPGELPISHRNQI